MECEDGGTSGTDRCIKSEVPTEEQHGEAGEACNDGSSLMALPVARICPEFLNSNSRSHAFPFSAIAELVGQLVNVCSFVFSVH